MSVKLLTKNHLECLSLKEAAQARLSQHLSKCHIVGNHMSRLKCHLKQLLTTGDTMDKGRQMITKAAHLEPMTLMS